MTVHILVTGGAGFIGSHLVRWLVAQQHTVRVLDNLSSGNRAWLGPANEQVEFVQGDIRVAETVLAAAAGVELIVHLAAQVSVVESTAHPRDAYLTNVLGSVHVLEAARHHNVRRVVQMSSCAIYGDAELLPIPESTPPQPLSPYASTKLAAEDAGKLYTRLYGVETVALRGFNIYGPRQSPTSPYAAVIPRFIAALQAGQPPTIFGDGLQSRDFIFVGDVVQALWTAASAPGIGGEVFNLGSGAAWSIRDLAAILAELLDSPVQPVFAAARSGEVRHSCASPAHFATRTGFRAGVTLREGLAQTLRG
jgi:nucleoside-diphosphate-sugar epimerase